MTAARPSTRRLALTAAVAALVSAAAACGSTGDDDANGRDVASLDDGTSDDDATDATTEGSTPTSVAPEDFEEAMLAYTECMRDHGIDMPDPQVSGPGGGGGIAIQIDADDEGFQEAEEDCSPLLENAMGEMEIDPEREAEMREDMLAFAECMRDHGIDVPDPVFSDDGTVTMSAGGPGGDRADIDTDEFEAASEECGQDGMMMSVGPADETERAED